MEKPRQVMSSDDPKLVRSRRSARDVAKTLMTGIQVAIKEGDLSQQPTPDRE